MKVLLRLCTMVALFLTLTTEASYAANLLQFSDLQYLGAFRVPAGQNLGYGGYTLGYNPGSSSPGSLFIGCFNTTATIAEISIPTPVNSTNLNNLPTAKLLQPCANPAAGTIGIGASDTQIGGILVFGDKLIVSEYSYYDASKSQTAAFFVKPNATLSQANATGPYTVSAPNIGFVDGWMAPVPSEWQAALKGPIASGNCCLSIISRTSWGPDAFAWDPAQLTNISIAVPSTPLFYYTGQNATIGQWDGLMPNNTTIWWNNAGTGYRDGGVIPNGTRSMLFFGSQGMDPLGMCYGEGTSDPSLNRKQVPNEPGVIYCYDPADRYKGVHGYPYQFQIMAYDLNELAAVAAGTKQPYSILPYAVWPLISGLVGVDGKNNETAGGAVYDPTLQRIYYTTPYTDNSVEYGLPLVQVWQVNTAGSQLTPPTSPSSVQVQ